MKQQLVVVRSVRQTEIPALLDLVSNYCIHKKIVFSDTFVKKIYAYILA
jgi:hypothetical protein